MDKEERRSIEEENTVPLRVVEAVRSALSFRKFLRAHNLSALDVALAAKVRYMVTWNISQGNLVRRIDAEKVRGGLRVLANVSYLEPIAVLSETIDAKDSIYGRKKRNMQDKQTLLQLRNKQWFDIPSLASASETSEEIVHHAIMGVPVYRDEAVRILEAYSKMTGETYTLENVLITLKFEGV